MQEAALEILRDSVGALKKFNSPFGSKPIVYADWIASGRCLASIEDYIQHNVLPYYGNTHTTTSRTGHQSTCFRQEARQIIAECVNAKITGRAAEDSVLFIGQGTTSAVDKLVSMLGLQRALDFELEESLRPVVFCSSYEHHSNLLPWRECGADVIEIAYATIGGVNLTDLEGNLKKYQSRKVKIGAFSAASNITGVITDVDAVATLLHQYQALAFFDYATAAPHLPINMNPVNPLAKKDAVYFSGHKFLGGPGSSGVLIVKRWLLPQAFEPPSMPGGGTVFYVTNEHHRYLLDREEREEGGSPQLIGDVKLALSMNAMREIGFAFIEARENDIMRKMSDAFQKDPRIVLLGREESGTHRPQLPIFSFLIRAMDRFLHFHFVSVLLNDLFGVQCRGGCMCAGPYAQRLLGISEEDNVNLERCLLDKHEVLRPGFTRLSCSYWMSDAEVEYIVQSVLFVAEHGWKFLPLYRYNHKTGEWAHTTRLTRFPERLWLSNFSIATASAVSRDTTSASSLKDTLASDWSNVSDEKQVFDSVLRHALDEVNKLSSSSVATIIKGKEDDFFSAEEMVPSSSATATVADNQVATHEKMSHEKFDHLRWYLLPSDIAGTTGSMSSSEKIHGPIQPQRFVAEALRLPHSGVVVDMTPYATIREKKLVKRTGQEEDHHLPRFLRMVLDHAPDKNSLLASLKSFNLKLHGTDNNSAVSQQIHSSAVLPPPVAPKENKSDVLASALATATGSSSNDNNEMTCAFDTCSTGTCTLREPTGYENNVVVENGKILSGPGNYFPAHPERPITGKFITPPKKFMKAVGQAIKEWGMIQDGDRLLLGLSGGKDSLALLHTLRALQIRAPVKFEFACATVDPQTTSFDPSPLIPYVQSLGITYHYLSQPIIQLAKSKLQGDSLCAFCSRFKRGLLYSCCRTYGYNKLILAQHLDDLCESFMMSLLHNGQTRTMKAKYLNDAGDITIIRPFIYLREAQTRDFSMQANLNIINENCPACFEQPKERARMKKLLQQEEAMVPNLFYNLKRALVPLMHDDTYYVLKEVADKIASAGNERYDYRTCSRKTTREEAKPTAAQEEDTGRHKTHQVGKEGGNEDDEEVREPAVKKLREEDDANRNEAVSAVEMTVDDEDVNGR